MNNSMIKESGKRLMGSFPKSRLLLAMCFIAITCACFAQDMFIAEDSTPSAPDQTVSTTSQAGTPFDYTYGIMQLQPVNRLTVMKSNYPALYSQYSKGRRMKTAGWILTGTGIGSFVLGIGLVAVAVEEDDDEIGAVGALSLVGGIAFMGAGIPILAVGGGKQRRALREFDRQYYSSESSSPYLQINLYPNRVGLAYVF